MRGFFKFLNALGLLNIKKRCREYRVPLWQCPDFLFLILGGVIILAILATYAVARIYAEPEVVILIIFLSTASLFVVSYIIVNAFERVALASKSKSEFISLMSHQLRNPLSSIKWQLEFLLEEKKGGDGRAQQNKFLLAIKEQNEKMINQINDLLELSQIENNNLLLSPERFSFKKLTEVTISKYSKYFLRPIVFKVSPDDRNSDFIVLADKNKIKDVLRRLLDNAASYSPKEDDEINVYLEKKNNFARLTVSDKGIGVSKEESGRIFQKYYRGEESRKYKTEGLGISLFLVRSIVQASGGETGFSSIEGGGSSFWFTLPLVDKH
jgi:signal transduction histidine kinase